MNQESGLRERRSACRRNLTTFIPVLCGRTAEAGGVLVISVGRVGEVGVLCDSFSLPS